MNFYEQNNLTAFEEIQLVIKIAKINPSPYNCSVAMSYISTILYSVSKHNCQERYYTAYTEEFYKKVFDICD